MNSQAKSLNYSLTYSYTKTIKSLQGHSGTLWRKFHKLMLEINPCGK